MPTMIHRFSRAVSRPLAFARLTAPKSRMPRARHTSPPAAKTDTAISTRYRRKVTTASENDQLVLRLGGRRWRRRILPRFFHRTIPGRAQRHERLRFFVKPLAFAIVEEGFAHDAEDRLRTEVIL